MFYCLNDMVSLQIFIFYLSVFFQTSDLNLSCVKLNNIQNNVWCCIFRCTIPQLYRSSLQVLSSILGKWIIQSLEAYFYLNEDVQHSGHSSWNIPFRSNARESVRSLGQALKNCLKKKRPLFGTIWKILQPKSPYIHNGRILSNTVQ